MGGSGKRGVTKAVDHQLTMSYVNSSPVRGSWYVSLHGSAENAGLEPGAFTREFVHIVIFGVGDFVADRRTRDRISGLTNATWIKPTWQLVFFITNVHKPTWFNATKLPNYL
jgi:hypothetical protein